MELREGDLVFDAAGRPVGVIKLMVKDRFVVHQRGWGVTGDAVKLPAAGSVVPDEQGRGEVVDVVGDRVKVRWR